MSNEIILVVDDGIDNREFVVEYILKPNGFDAITASNGQEGIKMAATHHPDLILLDLQMPKMNGREMLQVMEERGLDIPVVLMTFHGSEEIVIEMYRMGVKDYVKKPYSADEMLDAINRSLGEVRLRKDKDALVERMLQANRELQRRVQELNTLYQIGKTIAAAQNLKSLLPNIVQAAVDITNAEEGRIFLVAGDRLWCRAEKHQNLARPEPVEYETTDPAAIHVAQSQTPMMAHRDQYGDYPNSPLHAAYAPLILRRNLMGVIMVGNISDDSDDFSRNDTALLSALADYAVLGIETLREHTGQPSSPPPTTTSSGQTGDLKLGGVRQEVTVVFADIRDATLWADHYTPDQVMEMLNDYLSLAEDFIQRWEGSIDEVFGEGVMAIFNAPKRQSDHIYRAADMALALLDAATDLQKRKGYNISFSIGIHTGEAVVGYMGTRRAMNYTAVGDVVKVAKRLQENAQSGQILVEEAVAKGLGPAAQTKRLGELKLRNHKQPIIVHALHDLKPV